MYEDPSEGQAGSALDTIYGAATSGALAVDPGTGEATLKFLSQIQDMADRAQRTCATLATSTPLGGGFGVEVAEFNQRLGAGGPSSAQEVLASFGKELERLKEAVIKCMAAYRGMDADNARTLARAGGGL